jgi:Fe-S cluster assembly protein SufD
MSQTNPVAVSKPVNLPAMERYEREFAQFSATRADPPWVRQARSNAWQRFAELGFPTVRHEDWKYTNVAALERRPFHCAASAADPVRAEDVQSRAIPVEGGHRLVFVNGRYVAALSQPGALPPGVSISSLGAALLQGSDELCSLVSSRASLPESGFEALNGAFLGDGAFVSLAPGTSVEAPIQLFFLATEPDLVTHPCNVILAGAGSSATIVEHYSALIDAPYWTNAVTRIVLHPGAAIEHYKLQQEGSAAFHIASLHINQERDSRFASHMFSLGARLARTDIDARLNAEGCDVTLNGLYIVDGRQHVDFHTCIDHARANGTSREFYKGILDGAARGVFNGKVIVRPDAQNSNAQQSNRNLLLSDDAEVDTKPQLEIFADNVKCTHGATVGQLDPAQLFYLRSRGVDSEVARSLLTFGFAEDVIGRVRLSALRTRLEEIVLGRLPDSQRIKELL